MRRWIGMLIVVALAPWAWGQQQDRVLLSEQELEKAKVEDATRAALDRKIPSVIFTDVRLRDAIDFLRDVSGANIHVSWRAIDKAGLDHDTPINIHVKDVTLAKALSMVLADASDGVELKWVFDQGVIEIAPADCFPERYFIKFINVSDLTDAKDDEKAKELVELIVETVAPENWVQNGGKATIRYFQGILVTTATQETHDGIAALLKGYREARGKKEATGTAAAPRTTVAPGTPNAVH